MPAAGCQGKVILCNGGILSSLDSASLLAESRPDSWLRVWKDLEADFRSALQWCEKLRFISGCLNICIKDVCFLFSGGNKFVVDQIFWDVFLSWERGVPRILLKDFCCSTSSPLILTLENSFPSIYTRNMLVPGNVMSSLCAGMPHGIIIMFFVQQCPKKSSPCLRDGMFTWILQACDILCPPKTDQGSEIWYPCSLDSEPGELNYNLLVLGESHQPSDVFLGGKWGVIRNTIFCFQNSFVANFHAWIVSVCFFLWVKGSVNVEFHRAQLRTPTDLIMIDLELMSWLTVAEFLLEYLYSFLVSVFFLCGHEIYREPKWPFFIEKGLVLEGWPS